MIDLCGVRTLQPLGCERRPTQVPFSSAILLILSINFKGFHVQTTSRYTVFQTLRLQSMLNVTTGVRAHDDEGNLDIFTIVNSETHFVLPFPSKAPFLWPLKLGKPLTPTHIYICDTSPRTHQRPNAKVYPPTWSASLALLSCILLISTGLSGKLPHIHFTRLNDGDGTS